MEMIIPYAPHPAIQYIQISFRKRSVVGAVRIFQYSATNVFLALQ
jgi:hypothetical protein